MQTRLLDQSTLDEMHATAVEILARTGLAVEHAEIRSRLLSMAGFAPRGRRVLVAPERVADWLAAHRRRHPDPPVWPAAPAPLEEVTYGVLEYATWIVDCEANALRPMTREDVVAGAKLIHMLGSRGVHGGTPGAPCDVPPALQPLEQFLIGAEFCRGGAGTSLVSDLVTAGIVREMERVLGRDLYVSIWCPSPLVFGGPQVDRLWRFREEAKGASVGTMPVMGITAPCDPMATMTLCMAEILGGAAIIHAILPDTPVGIFPHPEPADMSSGGMAIGTPEWELLDLMHRDVLAYYHIEWNTKLLHTSAPLPNAQAQIERSTGALLGMQGGYRHFHGIGTLGVDEVWCPAQVMLDLEIVAHAARVARGVESAPGLELARLPDVVDAVVMDDGVFAGHETTVASYRRQYHLPRILQRTTRAQWAAAGMPDVAREAQRQAEALVKAHDYEPREDVMRELRALYEKGKARLLIG